MRLGIVSTVVGASDLAEAFGRAAAAGAEGIEIAYSSLGDERLLAQDDHPRAVGELAARHKLEIPSLNLAFLCREMALIGQGPAAERAQGNITLALKQARAIGAKVVLIPFFGKNTIETEQELERATELLMPLVEQAEEAQIILGIESTLNLSQKRFLLDQLGSSDFVKLYYDVGNAVGRRLDAATGIRELGAQAIAQVHFKDVRLSEGAPPDFDVALGAGNVDFSRIIQALKAVRYDGWIMLETPPGSDPVGSAKANLAYARGLLGVS